MDIAIPVIALPQKAGAGAAKGWASELQNVCVAAVS
jgi:hypothetical protein